MSPIQLDASATLSPPSPVAHDRRSGHLPSHSGSARTRPRRRRHRGRRPARCQSPRRARLDRDLSTSSRPRFLGHPSQHRPAPGMGRGHPGHLAGFDGPTTGSLRLPGHVLDYPVAPISSGSLGVDRILRRHAAPPVACLGFRLETAALCPGPGPATGREDATDPPIYQGVGAAGRRPVPGRDRPAAVPALASLLARRGQDAEVPLSGGNAKRVLFGALNPTNGTRLFLEREKQRKEDFQEFLGLIHQQYRGWRVSLVLDGDSSHTAEASRRDARSSGIRLVWLPVRCPELNPMDHLWRHGKERICANRQYGSIEELVHRFLHYLEGLSVEETLRKAGILSEDYWLQSE